MTSDLDIHPDFHAIKGRELSLKRYRLALINGILALLGWLERRKFAPIITREKICAPDGRRVPVLIVRPENLPSPSPALVYYHGGAFILKHAPQHIRYAVRYAREAACCLIFVDYRLAPKYPFPGGFDDCHAALRWAVGNAQTLGLDKDRIAVGGDSAGGAMAAAAAQKAVHEDGIRLCGQLLVYPVTDCYGSWPSATAYADVPPFKALSRSALWEAYLGHLVAADAPRYASPLHGELSGLAPAYVETAEFDPLHDEGNAYAEALRARGVDVLLHETGGAVHGYDLLAPDSALSRAAIESRIAFLRKVFRSGAGAR